MTPPQQRCPRTAIKCRQRRALASNEKEISHGWRGREWRREERLESRKACSYAGQRLAESSLIAVWLEQRSLAKRTATNQLHENKDSSLCRVGSAQPLQRAGQYGSQWQDAATEAFCDPGRHSSGAG